MAAVFVVLYIPDISKQEAETPEPPGSKQSSPTDEAGHEEPKNDEGVTETDQVKAENTTEETPLLAAQSPNEETPKTIEAHDEGAKGKTGGGSLDLTGERNEKKADTEDGIEKTEDRLKNDQNPTDDEDVKIDTEAPETKDPSLLKPSSSTSNINSSDVSPAPSSVKFDLHATEIETEEFSLYQAVQVTLEDLGIQNDIWDQTGQINDGNDDKDFWQVTFTLEKEQCDEVLRVLTQLGIGRIPNTSISMFPANYHEAQKAIDDNEAAADHEAREKKSEFQKSVNSKLMVAQVVDVVSNNSELNFDFLMFVGLASMIAAIGLAENSSVILVASMLVSPIMGPILAGTFGFMINYHGLCRQGVRNELISLAICILAGFVIGLITGAANVNGAHWGSTEDWPTSEMKSRGLLRSLWVGLLIALPSGAGVALSILGGNAGSLVGVAISASLLPPAVNAGMLWAYALVSAIQPPLTHDAPTDTTLVSYVTSNLTGLELNLTSKVSPTISPLTPPNCLNLRDNQYEFVYSCTMAQEAAILGAVSLFLTIVNIICIFFIGVACLWVKKVVPENMVPEKTRSFWKKDIEIACHSYRTVKYSTGARSDAGRVAKDMAKQFRDQIFPEKAAHRLRSSWHNLIKDLEDDRDDEGLHHLLGSNKPQLLKQFSMVGNRALDETLADERKYHTVHDASQLAMAPLSPSSDPESPFTTSGDLKRGILRSPTGPSEFLYNPRTIQRRRGRLSWAAREQHRKRHPSVPASLKYSTAGLPRIASATSTGKQFQITPVAEDPNEN